jgi:hypothetical protein
MLLVGLLFLVLSWMKRVGVRWTTTPTGDLLAARPGFAVACKILKYFCLGMLVFQVVQWWFAGEPSSWAYLGGTMCGILANRFHQQGRRFAQASADHTQSAHRRYVLYLRPFRSDETFIDEQKRWGIRESVTTIEDALWEALKDHADIMALRNPHTNIRPSGYSPIAVKDNWQAHIIELISGAQMIVVLASESPNVTFEIEHLILAQRLQETIFIFNNPTKADIHWLLRTAGFDVALKMRQVRLASWTPTDHDRLLAMKLAPVPTMYVGPIGSFGYIRAADRAVNDTLIGIEAASMPPQSRGNRLSVLGLG